MATGVQFAARGVNAGAPRSNGRSKLTQHRRRHLHIGILCAVAQQVIQQHDGHHRLGDRGGADADAGSWRPLVITSTASPFTSMERPGVVMLDVGLSARWATIG